MRNAEMRARSDGRATTKRSKPPMSAGSTRPNGDAKKNRPRGISRSTNSRRGPLVHARVLLRETRLPLSEIASICGLDVYTVAGLKLKMREDAAGQKKNTLMLG